MSETNVCGTNEESDAEMKLLTKEQLEKLTTKRLLAYKAALMVVPEKPNWDEEEELLNKTSPEWKATYAMVKGILSEREHVERE